MRTVRRLYFYLVTLIGLELVIWGTITLAQTLLNAPLGGAANILSSGLSEILVGVPIFLLHGWVVQRDALRDPEERANRLRAVFFYAVRLATLVPVVQSLAAALVSILSTILGITPAPAFFGFDQTLADHLVASVINAVAFLYFDRLLRREHEAMPDSALFADVRRFYAYGWMIYTLVLALVGVNELLLFALYIPSPVELAGRSDPNLVNGLAFSLLAAPLWALAWRSIQASQSRPAESGSMLRKVVLYGLTILLAALMAIMGMNFLSGAITWALGEPQTLATFSASYRAPLAMALTLGVVWAFYYRPLAAMWVSEAVSSQGGALRRLYRTLIALLGNGATFLGLWMLVSVLVDALTGMEFLGSYSRGQLSLGIAAVVIGIPLWLRPWLSLQAEARCAGAEGDASRRSVVRRAAFYLVIFLAVIGVMVNSGLLFYRLINVALGNGPLDLGGEAAHSAAQLALCGVWLAYHLRALRWDGREAQRSIARQRAAFPVLIFQSGDEAFVNELQAALKEIAPELPVTVLQIGDGLALSGAESFQAVVLPGTAAALPAWLANWLSKFHGQRLAVPLPKDGWVWPGAPVRSIREVARDTALTLRQLADGEPVRPAPSNNPWVIAGYVFGGLFVLEILIVAFAAVMSLASH